MNGIQYWFSSGVKSGLQSEKVAKSGLTNGIVSNSLYLVIAVMEVIE